MKIHILSKPETKTSGKGTTYYTVKVKDESGAEKSGNLFCKIEPQLDQEIEVDEKYNEEYRSYTWFSKDDQKKPGNGFTGKPSLSVEQQIRVIAIQEAIKSNQSFGINTISDARQIEEYIKSGK